MGGSEIKERLLIAVPLPSFDPSHWQKHLEKEFPEVEVTVAPMHGKTWAAGSDDLDPEIFKDKTIMLTFDSLPQPKDAPHLEWIHFTSAGINQAANTPIYKETDITLTTSNGIHGPQISEWVVMTTLAHSHYYNELLDSQREHEWRRPGGGDPLNVRDLPGQRLGVLGYGSIGRQVARVAKAMGMDVIAYTATPKDTPEKKKDFGYNVPGTGDPDGEYPSEWYSGLDKKSLHYFLAQDIDILVISLPLTNETHHLLGEEEFKILSKKKAFVSNVSRGKIIDQPAIVDALKRGDLRGAALDVTDPEPLPKDDPLWDAPNTIVTPHISGATTRYMARVFDVFEHNLRRRLEGKPLVNVVRRERGY